MVSDFMLPVANSRLFRIDFLIDASLVISGASILKGLGIATPQDFKQGVVGVAGGLREVVDGS